jgi:hypothetical protein
MEQVNLGEIIKLMHSLVSDASLGTNDDAPVPLRLRMNIENTLNQLRPHCERLGL